MIFYLLGILLMLYALYVLAFKTYSVDYKGKPTHRLHCMNAIYVALLIAAFIPVINIIGGVGLLIWGLMNQACEDIYIDSWLFRKPGEKKEDNK